MRRRILCALLALCLLLALLPVTVGAAELTGTAELDLSQGYISIRPDRYVVEKDGEMPKVESAAKEYVISYNGIQTTMHYIINLGTYDGEPGTYYVTLKDLYINSTNDAAPLLRVYPNSIVYLTLEGSNNLTTSDVPVISVHPNSKLYISGSGSLSADSEGMPAILGQGTSEIHISGEHTSVVAQTKDDQYGYKPFAIRQSAYDGNNPANLQLSVTDGATLEAYGGISATKLKLDDTATLWSQAWYNRNSALDCKTVEYRSDRGIYIYYYVPEPSAISVLHSTAENTSGTAVKVLSELNWTSCNWTLQDGVLSSEGAVLRRGVESLKISDTEYQGKLGSWALLNGQKRTITPPVTPKDPEGNLLQNLVGTGLFFVPDDFPFYDVDSNDWFYEPVKSAWQNDLIDGVTARYFKPERSLTVAQAVKLAAALHQKQSVGFVTLQNGGAHWYDNYVNYAVVNGLIEAAYQSKSAEAMNAPVTRAEFVHILSKTLVGAKQLNTVNSIPDVKAGDAWADEIYAFYRAGILTGSDRLGTFYPESSLKRSEAAAILVRLYDTGARQVFRLN